ncbi:hypothetical protein ZWY2020_014968 [Hordeum vulgare]|nr:hypothetical protein ZWY2020_014968 [Hordeum vulgare]
MGATQAENLRSWRHRWPLTPRMQGLLGRHQGPVLHAEKKYSAVCRGGGVTAMRSWSSKAHQDIHIEDQSEVGSNALSVNRMLLQKSCAQLPGAVQRLQSSDPEENEATTNFVRKIITDSMQNLEAPK